MADEVKTRITVEGDEALRILRENGIAFEELGDKVEGTGKKSKKSSEEMSLFGRVVGGVKNQLAGLAGIFLGAFGLNAIFDQFSKRIQNARQELQKYIDTTKAFSKAQLELTYLNMVDDPKERQFVVEQSAISGRSAIEGFEAYAALKSKNANATQAELFEVFRGISSKATQTSAPLTTLVEANDALRKGGLGVLASQNVAEQAAIEAGEVNPATLAPLLARIIPLAGVAGLTPGQAAGVAAAGTTLGGNSNVDITALATIIRRISGKGTPEGRKILERVGAGSGNFFDQLDAITAARQQGLISDQELESVVGAEALSQILTITRPEVLNNFKASANRVGDAANLKSSLVLEKQRNILGSNPVQSLSLSADQLEAQIEAERGQSELAARTRAVRAQLELFILQKGIDPGRVQEVLEEYDTLVAGEGFFNPFGANVGPKMDPYSPRDAAAIALREAKLWGRGTGELIREFARGGGGNPQPNVNIINQQFNGVKPPAERDSGRREQLN